MTSCLEKLLKGSNSRFTKNNLTPCMTHGLNPAIQHGLKELGNNESYSNSEDDEQHLGLEAINQNLFGEILHIIQKFIVTLNHFSKRIMMDNMCGL